MAGGHTRNARNEHTLTMAPNPFELHINPTRGEAGSPRGFAGDGSSGGNDYIVRMEAASHTGEHRMVGDALVAPSVRRYATAPKTTASATSQSCAVRGVRQPLGHLFPSVRCHCGWHDACVISITSHTKRVIVPIINPALGARQWNQRRWGAVSATPAVIPRQNADHGWWFSNLRCSTSWSGHVRCGLGVGTWRQVLPLERGA